MKQMFRKTSAALLSACLLCAATPGLTASADVTTDTIKGTFCQSTVKNGLENYGLEVYTYSDTLFREPAGEYKPALATTSAYLAMASASSLRVDETHAPDRDIRSFLEQTGFRNIETNPDYAVTPTMETMGVACGIRTVTDADGKPCTLLAIAPRSSGYGAEWGSNFILGTEGDAAGFSAGKQKVLDFVKQYAQQNHLTGNLKVWISGYSRGGAVADLTAAALIDDPAAVFGTEVTLQPDQIYAYTFEAPKAACAASEPRSDKYRTIFNVLSKNDIVALIAPGAFGFDRYGTDHILEEHAASGDMLRQLRLVNARLHYAYQNYHESPDGFRKRVLGMAVDGSTGTYPEAPAGTSLLPETQEAFIQMLIGSLSDTVPDRETYAQEVEPYLSELTGMFFPILLSEEKDAMTESASRCRYSTALLVYLYMDYELSRIPVIQEQYPDAPERLELFFNKTNRLALLLRVLAGDCSEEETAFMQAFISNLKPSEQEWITDVFGDFSPEAIKQARQKTGFSDWNLSEESIAEMKELFTMYRSFMQPDHTDGETVIYASYTPEHYEREKAYVKERLAVCYRDFMTEFLTANGASAAMIAHQTEDTACRTMPALAEAFLLDCPGRTDSYTEDIEDGESCGKLATILGNVNHVIYAHSMDAVLSWLRAEDPDYEKFYRPKLDRLYGCRRIHIAGTDGTQPPVHVTVYDADGNPAAEFDKAQCLSSNDEWIRMQDSRLLLPLEYGYTVTLTGTDSAEISVAVEEYSTYEGAPVRTFTSDDSLDWSRLTVLPGSEYTITVPAVDDPDLDWANTSQTVYTVVQTRMPETVPTETDQPTETPRNYTTEQLCDMAVRDYQVRTGAAVTGTAEVNADGTVTVRLTDAKGQTVDIYRLDPATGKGTDQAGTAVDLPQTGRNSAAPALTGLTALLLAAAGAWLMRCSGFFRKRIR